MTWHLRLEQTIKQALMEDIQTGDMTSEAIFKDDHICEAHLISKANGIFAGLKVFEKVFKLLEPTIKFEWFLEEGEAVFPGKLLCKVSGRTSAILTGERTALNFIQRMSGIATMTHAFVREIEGFPAEIVDTRKTVPGLRALDKYSVRVGGGKNHRMGLYDAVMIKDNHIDAIGGINQAVNRVKSLVGHMVKIEVEARNPEEVEQALEAGADVVLLDNMAVDVMAEMVRRFGDQIQLEASGNMSLEKVRDVAQTGVHYISVGALTHSVQALDLSLVINLTKKEGFY